MANINLLPQEQKASGAVLSIGKSLTRLVIIGFALFAVSVFLVIAVISILTIRISSGRKNYESIKEQVIAKEQTEQRFFLFKDRLQKIGSIYSSKNIASELEILSNVVDKIDEGVVFSSAALTSDKATIEINTDSSANLARFLARTVQPESYSKVQMESFRYLPEKGYVIEFSYFDGTKDSQEI